MTALLVVSGASFAAGGLYGLKGAYLARVNETGVPGIWECRPSCAADLPQETLLPMALETPPGVDDSSTPESKSE